MSVEDPLWGAPRIHGELLKLGFEVAQSSVAKLTCQRTFIQQQLESRGLCKHALSAERMGFETGAMASRLTWSPLGRS